MPPTKTRQAKPARQTTKPRLPALVTALLLCLTLTSCLTEGKHAMDYDPNNLEQLTDAFFVTGAPSRSDCVKNLDNMKWERSGGKMGSQLAVKLVYDKDGYNYNFLYVDQTDESFTNKLTARIHTTKDYRLLHGAALHGNRFTTGIGGPSIPLEWKHLLDDNVRDYLDTPAPPGEQDKWNQKILDEYTTILQCYFNQQHHDR